MCYCCRGGTTAESKDKMTCMSKLYGSVAMATAYCLVLDLVEVLVTVAAWFTQIVKSSTKQPLSMPTIPPPLLTRPSSARTRFTPSTVSNVTTTTTSPQVVPSASLTQQTPNSSSGSSSQAQTYPSNAPVPLQPYDPSWVVIGIPSWALLNIKDQIYHDEIENIDMSSTLMNDTTFFAELRRLDDKYRWPVLKWLSPWIFTHCKFVRVCLFYIVTVFHSRFVSQRASELIVLVRFTRHQTDLLLGRVTSRRRQRWSTLRIPSTSAWS